jgi:hypothetical protein
MQKISKSLLLCSLAAGIVASAQTTSSPKIGTCQVFPADNVWNTPVDRLPVHRYSSQYIASIGLTGSLHPDFGTSPYGIPFIQVPGTQPKANVTFDYASESDPGPYPIPNNAPIEQGSDHHVIVIDKTYCVLYELYSAQNTGNLTWYAGSGAIFDLKSDALRPAGWTSADAAGLPIFPGLVRYDDVAAGAINHALRVTVAHTQNKYVWPARHFASSSSNTNYPPMGTRLRLKASFDISSFPAQDQVILRALKKYGMIIADNGSNWFLSGTEDNRWNNTVLHALTQVKGSNFEVVDESSLQIAPNSGRAQ